LAGERTQAPQAALVDASVRRSMNILDLTIESAVEGLAATEAPDFLCFYNMDQRYQAVSIFLSAFRCLDREARTELVFDCYRTRIIIFTSTMKDSGVV
jgi:hypothetical protein